MSLGRNWLRNLIAVLSASQSPGCVPGQQGVAYKTEQGGILWAISVCDAGAEQAGRVGLLTVFFFARSPEAPRTTITVLSLSSRALWVQQELVLWPPESSDFPGAHGLSSRAQRQGKDKTARWRSSLWSSRGSSQGPSWWRWCSLPRGCDGGGYARGRGHLRSGRVQFGGRHLQVWLLVLFLGRNEEEMGGNC